ncbi:hypothetical protein QBC36DRAFT_52752 [Triangularia setosa]|uniref:Uncharacterized protein n=1 Tax=Triangularia setosa TaxID=2587417 RepID=A0AAN6W3Q8_9PEZI|nr:hypothetical protein QBC36DRAFT_52752 [Podospora setosa]
MLGFPRMLLGWIHLPATRGEEREQAHQAHLGAKYQDKAKNNHPSLWVAFAVIRRANERICSLITTSTFLNIQFFLISSPFSWLACRSPYGYPNQPILSLSHRHLVFRFCRIVTVVVLHLHSRGPHVLVLKFYFRSEHIVQSSDEDRQQVSLSEVGITLASPTTHETHRGFSNNSFLECLIFLSLDFEKG